MGFQQRLDNDEGTIHQKKHERKWGTKRYRERWGVIRKERRRFNGQNSRWHFMAVSGLYGMIIIF